MPGGDRTGPNGFGPMTGRQAGLCAGNTVPGYASAPAQDFNRGFYGGGGRRGGGRGRAGGRGFYGYPGPAPQYNAPVWTGEQERDYLKNRADGLKRELENIESRLKDLETNQK